MRSQPRLHAPPYRQARPDSGSRWRVDPVDAGLVAERLGNAGGGIDQQAYPFVLQALGRGRDGQARDQLAGVVVDAGGDAAYAQFQLFVVARVSRAGAPGPARARGGRARSGCCGCAGQPGTQRIGAHQPRIVVDRNSLPVEVRCRAPARRWRAPPACRSARSRPGRYRRFRRLAGPTG